MIRTRSSMEVKVAIDLGAKTLVGAEKEGKKIAVEIKSFASGSFIYDFHTALVISFDLRKQPQRAGIGLFSFMANLSLTKVCPSFQTNSH